MTPVLALIALQCTLCWTIKVPVQWNNSEVQNNSFKDKQNEFPVQTVTPHSIETPIPKQYFEYTAKKPQFATDIAAFHGVKSPDKHYKAYPVSPYTGAKKPELGKHHILDSDNQAFEPYQNFVKNNEYVSYVTPASSNYNIFHPYEAEEPSLKAIYQDPVLTKIRNDLKDSQYRLQKNEEDGKSNIQKEEYLENLEQTDRKKFPHKHLPTQFEIHRPQRRPIYYVPPARYGYRDHILNQKIRHPWNQNYAKVTPFHYRPVKNHLHRLRQQHALKYDDENNEYPQIQSPLGYEEKPDGYDIYEKGKHKFTQLRHNVDESINSAVKKNRPASHEKLELQTTDNGEENLHNENEFLPVKNYAQVRKIETIKHLPRAAAFQDAETYDELRNAPRLREAIKSTKAQTVYSEEGYEDSAYDHAGEQKHASDHEGHGGYLKEKELSKGKYKIPSFSGSYEDGRASSYRDNVLHGQKWKNDDKEKEKLKEEEDYSEDDQEYYNESDLNEKIPIEKSSASNQKSVYYDPESRVNIDTATDDLQHDLIKREAKFKVPEINLNTTILDKHEKANTSLIKKQHVEFVNLTNKYPYYHKQEINKDSPLRYAENLENIPKKSKGGTEFYDSRTRFECPEVEKDVDPLPDKLKKGGNPDEAEEDEDNQNNNGDTKPRLNGLGDKIDCFKIKYFGENPLDSPFFGEDLISSPEAVTAPSSLIFKLFKYPDDGYTLQSQIKNVILEPENNGSELIENDKNDTKVALLSGSTLDLSRQETSAVEKLHPSIVDIVDETKPTDLLVRKTRAAPFIYEPYKIIRDSQIQDSKKTTTSSNISPLIKQLQSSRVVDRVAINMNKDQPVKRNTGSLSYKNIGRKDREKVSEKLEDDLSNSTFIDVNQDTRKIEPKFEQRPMNHKPQYVPVENRNSMSLDSYTNRTNFENKKNKDSTTTSILPTIEGSKIPYKRRPFFDVSKYLPQTFETQKPEPSNNVQNIREIMEKAPDTKKERVSISSDSQNSNESDEEYDEYEDEEEETMTTTTTTRTSTTTIKPRKRKRIRIMTTTNKPQSQDNQDKLRLVTRFRNTPSMEQNPVKSSKQKYDFETQNKKIEDDRVSIPKYREKKKKSSQSTLVTDSTSYGEDGDDDDDMRKEEVDDLIGIQHDMEEYIPRYEKQAEREHEMIKSKKAEDKPKRSKKKEDSDEEDEEEITHDTNSEEDEDDSDEDNEDDSNSSENQDDDSEDDRSEEEEEEDNDKIDKHTTTPEPPRRTLIRTTEAPEVITKSWIRNPEVKPIISKKKIEIHKELPYRKSSPNVTQFKQDIKEIEIVKEIPAPKTNTHNVMPEKDAEVLQLYKDENLAKEVNKLFDVEVFKEDLDLKKSPRHGGNYKSVETDDSDKHSNESRNVSKKDSLSSQTQTKRLTEPSSQGTRYRGSTRVRNATQRSTKDRGQKAKAEKKNNRESDTNNVQRSAKLIELNDDEDEQDGSVTDNMHGGNFKTYSSSRSNGNPMHGGNYRSARIIQSEKQDNAESLNKVNARSGQTSKNIRRNSAALLDSFVRAVPILTTTPAYILDPSKRMYYYVDS